MTDSIDRSDLQAALATHCFTTGLAPTFIDRIVEHATLRGYREDEVLFREGEPAMQFHLVIDGRVAIETHVPGRGPQVVDTVEACETVGWSWLVPPYRWLFDARAVTDTTAVTVDGVALRGLCEDDPVFGYALMQQVAQVMLERMRSARVRLIDLYGPHHA
jgi:CRP-like cAMP-binding protein